jgi:hypothetical protein
MGDERGPKKVNDTCVKTMHVGLMDRGFMVITKIKYCLDLDENSSFRITSTHICCSCLLLATATIMLSGGTLHT